MLRFRPAAAVQPSVVSRARTARALFMMVALGPVSQLAAQILDAGFNPNANATVSAILPQPDGAVLVGGSFSRIAGISQSGLARINNDGAIDAAFNPRLFGTVFALARQTDGRILVGGSIGSVAGQPLGRLIRLNPDGSLDGSFAPMVVGTVVRAILIQPDGRILVGGDFTAVGGIPRNGLVRLNTDGSLDSGFTADASGTHGSAAPGVFALAREADGSILLGGQFTTVNGQTRYGLARVRANGALDTLFNPLTSFSSVMSISVRTDGRILLGGGAFVGSSQTQRYLARMYPNGTFDPSFTPGPNAPVQAVSEQPDGKLVVGGIFTSIGGGVRGLLARLEANGALDPTFDIEVAGTMSSSQPQVVELASTNDGRIFVGGSFTSVAGQNRGGLARLVPPSPQFVTHPASQSTVVGGTITFRVTVAGETPTYQWRKDGVPIAGATRSVLILTPVTSSDAGRYDVIATNRLGTSTSAAAMLAIDTPPVVTRQPEAVAVVAGHPATLFLSAIGSPSPTYQWHKNGAPIAGATSAAYAIASTQFADSGNYTCVISNAAGKVVSEPALLTVLAPARLTNVSVRTALSANQVLIVGFVVRGGAKDVLVRAAGPALAEFGVPAAMVDPRLELYQESTKLLENNDWPAVLGGTMNSLGAFPFPPNSRDAAMLQSANGGYSAVVAGADAGVVLVEIYDAGSPGGSRLVNVSARNRVGTDADRLITGFNIAGAGTKRVLIRAIGPTLGGVPFNVPDTLADPVLEVYDHSGVRVGDNANWDASLASAFSASGAFALAPQSKDAALVLTLGPGSYTAVVSGANNTTGVALVEVYELP